MIGYGKELVLDLHGCDASLFTREAITRYFEQLCQLIDMKGEDLHFWDDSGLPPEECQTDPKTKGTTAVQFILTSNIIIHALDVLEAVYVNVFSCREFDVREAADFTASFFRAARFTERTLDRI